MNWLGLGLGLGLGSIAACGDLSERGAGDQCTRSTQCAVGLACIDGVCGDDLSAVAEQSEVPQLVMPTDASPAQDAAVADDDAGQ